MPGRTKVYGFWVGLQPTVAQVASGWLAAGHIQTLPEFRPDIHAPIAFVCC